MRKIIYAIISAIVVILICEVLLVIKRQRSELAARSRPARGRPEKVFGTSSSDRAGAYRSDLVFIREEVEGKTPAPPPGDESPAVKQGSLSGSIPNEHVLGFYDNSDMNTFVELVKARGGEVLDVIGVLHAVRIRVSGPEEYDELLRQGPVSIRSSANYYVRLPQDPVGQDPMAPPPYGYIGFGDQSLEWLGVMGDNSGWGRGITIAVIDSGIATHPVLENANIRRVSLLDGGEGEYGFHGTAVASLIAGNGPGVRGVAPAASVLSVQVMDASGTGDSFTLARGIIESVDMGARVINISLGSRCPTFVLKSAVDYAAAKGALVVASVGNEAVEGVLYPAAYENVLAVSGVDAAGRHLYFANRGPQVDISAPGILLDAAGMEDSVNKISGTSAAAALVSGAAAWLLAENTGMSAGQAVEVLLANANDTGAPGRDSSCGEGILDINRIVNRSEQGIYDAAVCNPYVYSPVEGQHTVVLTVQNRGTEHLAKLGLEAEVAGKPYYVDFYSIPPGAVKSYELTLNSSMFKDSEGVPVECKVTIDGNDDTMSANNALKGSIIIPN